jgi:hypothetical protein
MPATDFDPRYNRDTRGGSANERGRRYGRESLDFAAGFDEGTGASVRPKLGVSGRVSGVQGVAKVPLALNSKKGDRSTLPFPPFIEQDLIQTTQKNDESLQNGRD